MKLEEIRNLLERYLPEATFNFLRRWYRLACIYTGKKTEDNQAFIRFMDYESLLLSKSKRLRFLNRLTKVSLDLNCPHTESDVLEFIHHILCLGQAADGVFIEAGCFKGCSTAKFSMAANVVDKKLIVFDSFHGLPANDEHHGKNIYGEETVFWEGRFRGELEEVRRNVAKYGSLSHCEFIKGWFEDTMPIFRNRILGAYLDVDLVASTRTCIKCLYPQIEPGGVLLSQDGHLPLVLALLDDEDFWNDEVGVTKPIIEGFGTSKLLTIRKPSTSNQTRLAG